MKIYTLLKAAIQRAAELQGLLDLEDASTVPGGISKNGKIEPAEADAFVEAAARGTGYIAPAEAALTGFVADVVREFSASETVHAGEGDMTLPQPRQSMSLGDIAKQAPDCLNFAERLVRADGKPVTPGAELTYAELTQASGDPLASGREVKQLRDLFSRVKITRSVPVYSNPAAGVTVGLNRDGTGNTDNGYYAWNAELIVQAPVGTKVLVSNWGRAYEHVQWRLEDHRFDESFEVKNGTVSIPARFDVFRRGQFASGSDNSLESNSLLRLDLVFVGEGSDGRPKVMDRVRVWLPEDKSHFSRPS